jgi:hypothetical protein
MTSDKYQSSQNSLKSQTNQNNKKKKAKTIHVASYHIFFKWFSGKYVNTSANVPNRKSSVAVTLKSIINKTTCIKDNEKVHDNKQHINTTIKLDNKY